MAKKRGWKRLRAWQRGALIGLFTFLVFYVIFMHILPFLQYVYPEFLSSDIPASTTFLTMLLFVGIPFIVAGIIIGYFMGRK